MNEIDVVVDVRQSPDTGEIIVSKQKLAFNGDARLVGIPVQSRVGLMTRKAKVSMFEFADTKSGSVVAARVKNIGTVPFEITRVVFEYEYKDPQEVRSGTVVAQDLGGSVDFIPKDKSKTGPLQPGEERAYYLPDSMYDNVAILSSSFPIDQFRVATYSGIDEVGLLAGMYVRPFFDRIPILFHRRSLPLYHTLPEADRFAIIRAVAHLRALERDRWPSAGAKHLEGTPDTFVVWVDQDLGVIVRPLEDNQVEIDDIVRKSILEQFVTSGEGSKQ